LDIELIIKRDGYNSNSTITLQFPKNAKKLFVIPGPPNAIAVTFRNKKDPLPNFLAVPNGDTLKFYCEVTDKYGNLSRLPHESEEEDNARHIAVMSNSLKSLPQFPADSGRVKIELKVESNLYSSSGSLIQPLIGPDMVFTHLGNSDIMETYQAANGDLFCIGDCVVLRNSFIGIIEAFTKPANKNASPGIYIRYFTKWRDRSMGPLSNQHKVFFEAHPQRPDELLLTDWTQLEEVTAKDIVKRIVVYSRKTYDRVLRCRGIDPTVIPPDYKQPIQDVFFCSKVAFYKGSQVERVQIMDDSVPVKSCPPLPSNKSTCTVLFWADKKIHNLELPQGNTRLSSWFEKFFGTVAGLVKPIGVHRFAFSVNGHVLDPDEKASAYKFLEPGCIVLCQPSRVFLDDCNDTIRFALVTAEPTSAVSVIPGTQPKRAVMQFRDLRTIIEPGNKLTFIELSQSFADPSVSVTWVPGKVPFYSISAKIGAVLHLRASLKTEGFDLVTGLKGALVLGTEEFAVTESGEVDFDVTMSASLQKQNLTFVVSNQRDAEPVRVPIDFVVQVGEPHLVVLASPQYDIVSGQRLSLEASVQDEHGNSAFTPETAPMLSFAYQCTEPDVSPCPVELAVGVYRGNHRWQFELPRIFARAGSHTLSILGSYIPPAGVQKFISKPAIISVNVSAGPVECLAIPNHPTGIEVRTRETLPEIIIEAFDSDNPLYRNVVHVDGDVSVKSHPPGAQWLEPALTSHDSLPIRAGRCSLPGDRYRVTSANAKHATITFSYRMGGSGRKLLETSAQIAILPSESTPFTLALSEPDSSIVSHGKLTESLVSGAALPKFVLQIISETNALLEVQPYLSYVAMTIYRKSFAVQQHQLVATIKAVPMLNDPTKVLFVPEDPAPFSRTGDYFIEFTLKCVDPYLELPSLRVNFSIRPGVVKKVEISSTFLTNENIFLDQIVSVEYTLSDGLGNVVPPAPELLEVRLTNLPPELGNCILLEAQDRPSRSGSEVGRLDLRLKRSNPNVELPHSGIAFADLEFRVDSPEEVEPTVLTIRLMLQSASKFQDLSQRRNELALNVDNYKRELGTVTGKKAAFLNALMMLNNQLTATHQRENMERERIAQIQQQHAQEGNLLRERGAIRVSNDTIANRSDWVNPTRGVLGALINLFFVDHSAAELGGMIENEHPAQLLNIALSQRLGRDLASLILDPSMPRTPQEFQLCRATCFKLMDEIQQKCGRNYDYNWMLVCDLAPRDADQLIAAAKGPENQLFPHEDFSNVPGCLGYAVNLLKLSPLAREKHLRARVLMPLLSKTLVFRTEKELDDYAIVHGTRPAICLDNPFKVMKQGRVERRKGNRSWRDYNGSLFPVRPLHQRTFASVDSTVMAECARKREDLTRQIREFETNIQSVDQHMEAMGRQIQEAQQSLAAVDSELQAIRPPSDSTQGDGLGPPSSKRQKQN
jgi:hypothetical protein